MAEAFFVEKYMAERQDFPCMAKYLNWLNLNWPNCNWPNLNQPNFKRPNRLGVEQTFQVHQAPVDLPARSELPPYLVTRQTFFIRPALYLSILNHFIYFLANFGHSDISYSANWNSAITIITGKNVFLEKNRLFATKTYFHKVKLWQLVKKLKNTEPYQAVYF